MALDRRPALFWLLAALITIASAVWQRLSGPTYPLRGTVEIGGEPISMRLTRTQGGEGGQPVSVRVPDPDVTGEVTWRRFPTQDPWQTIPLERRDQWLGAELPQQPPAGKLEYQVRLRRGPQTVTFPLRPAVTRFKGTVPAWLLVPHVAAMLLAMLCSTRAGLEALRAAPNLRALTWTTLASLALGGFLLGPAVQKAAFDAWWTGFPWGYDLTDNKTLLAGLCWLWAGWSVRRGAGRWAVALAAVATLVVFAVPHSVWGSEVRWDRPQPAAASRSSRLVVAYTSGPLSLLSYMSTDEVSASILRNAYEPLLDVGRDLALVPCLAESWYTPDELTWVFRLRPGVRLHDGRVLEARHVAAYIERSRDDPKARRSIGYSIATIEAPDSRTLVIRTSRPYGWLPNNLTGLPIAVDAQREGAPPVGTGPYAVKAWTSRGDTVLEAFADHRNGPPSIQRLEFRVVPDTHDAVQLLRRGEIDLMVDVPPEDWPALQAQPGIRTPSQPGLRVVFLGFNTLKGSKRAPNPLRDLRVRRAIALAIDRQAIVEGRLAGNADLVDELVAPDVFGARGDLPPRPFDLAAARRLLATARPEGGLRLTLDFVPGRYPNIEGVAEALVSALQQVGIDAVPRRNDLAGFRERVAVKHETDLFLMGWLSAVGDAATTFENLVQSPAPAAFGVYSNYANPEVDRLLRELAGPVGIQDRKAILQAVGRIVYDDLPALPLYRQRDLYAAAADLEFAPRIDRRIRGTEMRWLR